MFLSLLAILTLFGYLECKPIIIRNISDCSLTQDGILLYQGKHSFTKFEHECLPWADFQTLYSDIVNEANFFNDPSIKEAENYCRNPDMNVNGPWCFVQDDDVVSMEECNVCQSLSFRPPVSNDIENVEDVTTVVNNNFFENVRDEIRRYSAYVREKIMEIINRMTQKFKQFGSKISDRFKFKK